MKINKMPSKKNILLFCILTVYISACETESEKAARIKAEEQQRLVLLEAEKAEKTDIARRLEQERIDKAIYDKYISNSLPDGATPYANNFGRNEHCNSYGCSEIKVSTSNSDVLVTIKNRGNVVRHGYINANSSYSFSMRNGVYQTFFYYGSGWNPEKEMKDGTIKGGFVDGEEFGKDSSVELINNILEYQLVLQANGNFSTRPSNSNEAF